MTPSWAKLDVDLDVQNELQRLNAYIPEVVTCLIATFERLRQGIIPHGNDDLVPNHYAIDRCGYIIMFSVDKKTGVILITKIFPFDAPGGSFIGAIQL